MKRVPIMADRRLHPTHKLPLNAPLARFVETLGARWEGYGLPRGAGRIFGLLQLAAQALSAEEISGTLRVSRSSVSTDVRGLLSIGLVERIRVPGDRTGYYVFSPHAWEHVAAIRSQEARRYADLAEHTLGALPGGHPGRKGLEDFKEWAVIFGEAVDRVRGELSARARRRAKGGPRG
jgi:predicted transcriptional regulator